MRTRFPDATIPFPMLMYRPCLERRKRRRRALVLSACCVLTVNLLAVVHGFVLPPSIGRRPPKRDNDHVTFGCPHPPRLRPPSTFLFRYAAASGGASAKNDDFDDDATATALPPNLRRKISARRPTRGNVVPKAIRAARGGSSNPQLRPQGKRRDAGLNNPSMLQISAGSAKGRRLDSPDVYLRPMMGKVREAVFSTLASFGFYEPTVIRSVRHLDIFAGSGSVGLESLSRGADHCTFVDLSPDCCDAIRRNIRWCQFDGELESGGDESRARVVCADAFAALTNPSSVGILTPDEGSNNDAAAPATFDIVTLCPPYEEVVYGDLLEAVANSALVAEDTVVVVEYPVELGCLPHVVRQVDGGGAMVGVRNRRYGRTVIAMYIVNPSGKLETAYSRPEEFVKL